MVSILGLYRFFFGKGLNVDPAILVLPHQLATHKHRIAGLTPRAVLADSELGTREYTIPVTVSTWIRLNRCQLAMVRSDLVVPLRPAHESLPPYFSFHLTLPCFSAVCLLLCRRVG